ncbi:uncharacterized protein LOC110116774 isoform X2 [Athalia rosae]|uniref:uncharacterized protein LOC110116774 isoform X2 n=1 Tax=Athalia rosae TaxID=37344 RepID=UPI002033E51E|nr:uncharacterized protein LOC110116774 isoform X2 [Athalia rosae]XP_012261544.2 uncharacterized protein LOC110116774 isoform X2 [Athalia rosae]XP_020709834.2 uncharacterized protein LOC110116774 isoform X2 [Athalia rosae]XP_048513785.1 uncharacterized protein LOC110116774 isoform X2 [Athalia rosae]XP_048513786.1 uncharacterized protein LOC110116774 isoform X2 [Athalia rosae]
MGFIEDELQELSKLCHNVVEGSRLVSCVRTMVRVEITKTTFKKIVICAQFPEDYPKTPLLVELKSKTLSDNLLAGLTNVCEQECKKLLGKAQVLPVLKFIRNFIHENSLCCCYDEIATLKKLLGECDKLQLKQKNSRINLKICQGLYYFKTKILVPDNYPDISVSLEDIDTNFPPVFTRHLVGQGKELGRRCVEAPLKKLPNQLPFKPKPSLCTVVSFLIRSVKTLPDEHCQLCTDLCLPCNPQDAVTDENSDLHIERLYCSHLFHQQCLITYMKTPPFHGGKKCPGCGQRVYHDKWVVSERLAEDRWAHEQARVRELAEVADFFE